MCRQNSTVPAINGSKAKSEKGRSITLQELKGHSTPEKAWTAVHGRVLDISDFALRHPGGDAILLAAGRDATVLFETYHPRGIPSSLLDKLQIGEMKKEEISSSFYSWDSDFYKTLRQRVVARLEERGLTRRGGWEIWAKAIFLLSGFWYSLFRMYTETSFFYAALWSMVMGVFAAFIGTCIQHDGNHGAFSTNGLLNKAAGWTLDMIGASAFTWEFQHMLGHHPYTNLLDLDEEKRKEKGIDCPLEEKDQESDPDVFSSFPAMRMHPLHKAEWYHRFQHIYGPLLFALMTLAKVFQQDFEVAMSKRLYHIDATCRYGSALNMARFWLMKVVSMVYMVGLPCYFHGAMKGACLFLLGHFTCGEVLATMFIVNHVIEGVSFAQKSKGSTPAPGKEGEELRPKTVKGASPMEETRSNALALNSGLKKVPFNDWAAVQCQTSVNWSPGSWFWNHFSGGLSHQIEHHLFPSICHTNYVHIQDVVEQTCLEYGVPYQSESSLFSAYKKMISHLKYLGTEKKEG